MLSYHVMFAVLLCLSSAVLQVCNDVQVTVYEEQCGMVTNTRTKCDIIFSQQCQKVCKPSCKKITTTTTTTTMPISTGKGMPVMMSMGKGH